ncbi:MAG: heme exporter protein CcmD [Alphaproteobacteria bacterium TMED89]|nr:hypothetical protein [Rhodospirillaceae bacterium]RPH16902.1 MAG: heme exporter protein CcmD [Alphaproteobacteria bacterium TMED89]
MDDRFVAVWGSYGAAALAMIGALVVARLVLNKVRRELEQLKQDAGK